MNIVVTGGLGFIGSHLVDLLLESEHQITIIDNLSNNTVSPEQYTGKCKVLVSSIQDTVENLPINTDIVFHLASIVGPSGVLKYPGDMGMSILGDSILLRDFCIKSKALLVDISTSEIYGHTGVLYEDSKKVFPKEYQVRTEYGASKMVSEICLVNKARVNKNFKYHIIRPFNVVGARQKPDCGFVLPRFVISVLTGQPITIFGDGTQKRAFTDVSDICNAIVKITFSNYKNEIWNIGNPNNEITINALADRVMSIVGKKSDMKFMNPKEVHGEMFSEVPDKLPYIFKLKELVNWSPEILLDDTIKKVVEYYTNKVNEGYNFNILKG